MPAALSPVATTAQDGSDFQAGGPHGSENASSATGRWVAAIRAACSAGQVGGERVVELRGIDRELDGGLRAVPVGYWSGTSAVFRTLSLRAGLDLAQALALVGGEGGDEDEADDVRRASVAALEITAPP